MIKLIDNSVITSYFELPKYVVSKEKDLHLPITSGRQVQKIAKGLWSSDLPAQESYYRLRVCPYISREFRIRLLTVESEDE